MRVIKQRWPALLLAAVLAVLAVCLPGCGGGDSGTKSDQNNTAGTDPGTDSGTTPGTDAGPIAEHAMNPDGAGGTLTYDGKRYRTVVINGKTWMAENLNIAPSSGGSWCYGGNEANCDRHGRLYDWETAKAVCPSGSGWRLPDRADWNGLLSTAGGAAGAKLKSANGWNNREDGSSGGGTDALGFSALPGGIRDPGGNFYFTGQFGRWWTATAENNLGFAYSQGMGYIDDEVEERSSGDRSGFSVRCVK